MALFAVNRFLGVESDSEEDSENTTRNPADILAQLQAQAEKRKKERRKESDGEIGGRRKHDETQEEEEPSPKRKKKKDKHRHEDDDSFPEEGRKKKSRKGKDIQEDVAEKDSDGEKNKKSKKKKKDKKSKDHVPCVSDLSTVGAGTYSNSRDSDLDSVVEEKSEQQDKVKDLDIEMESESVSVPKQDAAAMVTVEEGGQEIGGFTVLGDFKKKDKLQVHRVLPDWLSSPSVISADLRNKRLPVGDMPHLDHQLVERLAENSITHFFPVQMQVIPELLSIIQNGCQVGPGGYRPNDICVSAPTGSGKTLAFVLPIVQALKDRVVRRVRAVVVLPVKDLATQVYKVFQTYVHGTDIKVGLVVGQKSFSVEQQTLVMKKLRGSISLVDILVATPGRLVDHVNKTDGLDLSHLRFLVIDEADRMMDDIKQDWLATLEGAVYNQDGHQAGQYHRDIPGPLTVTNCSKMQIPLQKLLFSATLSQNPEKLQHLNLFQPRLFTSVVTVTLEEEKRIGRALTGADEEDAGTNEAAEKLVTRGEFIGKYTTPVGLTEYYVRVTASEKPLIILHFLHHLKFRHVLCFTNSREATHRLYLLVKQFGGVHVEEFSSNLSVNKRNKIISNFSAGKIDLLICSDVMARGMDVENVKYVISYDTTPHIKTYIHRIGRTARAGKVGSALTLLENKEVYHFKKMIKEAGKTNIQEMDMQKDALSPLVPEFQVALKKLPQLLMEEKKKKKQKG